MRVLKTLILIVCGLVVLCQYNYADAPKKNDVVLQAMQEELARSMNVLGEKGTPPPYFIGYQITDNHVIRVSASYGAIRGTDENRSRLLDVDVRVGSHKLDNTHTLRGGRFNFYPGYSSPMPVSLTDDPDAIKSAIWLETDIKYKDAVERMVRIKADKSVLVDEEDQSDDFSKEKPRSFTGDWVTISLDTAAWGETLKRYSAFFNDFPGIHTSSVSLSAIAANKYFVNSEGTVLRHGRTYWRLSITAETMAEDGMNLAKSWYFDCGTPANLPDDLAVKTALQEVADAVLALRKAPLMEPYTGPAILSPRASAVFFHEIFGHRIEGHRQKDESEGQTFTKKIDQEVLPAFISVFDDPNLETFDGNDLNGHYLYDDEGIKAQRVDLVQKGILKNFLMSRSPIEGFPNSNGHGRCQPGRQPESRQGVLVIEASRTVPMEKLRAMLIEECKKQGKEFGLLFDDIAGGFTMTRRYSPQAFNVNPVIVYRVYTDGRPDELVRGVDLIGTPLTSFSQITACGDTPGIFNGHCGSTSGRIPASAISPPILTTQIEVQKKAKSSEKPPVLPPPARRSK